MFDSDGSSCKNMVDINGSFCFSIFRSFFLFSFLSSGDGYYIISRVFDFFSEFFSVFRYINVYFFVLRLSIFFLEVLIVSLLLELELK